MNEWNQLLNNVKLIDGMNNKKELVMPQRGYYSSNGKEEKQALFDSFRWLRQKPQRANQLFLKRMVEL